MIALRREADGVSFDAWVRSRSSRAEIGGIHDGALRARLTAPPAEGAANRRRAELISRKMRVPRRAVRIVSGAASRRKRVKITTPGVREMSVLRGLAQSPPARGQPSGEETG